MADRFPRATDTSGLLLGDLPPGTRVGEYVIEAARPTRGTGHLYEAVHRVLPRRVQLKVIPAAQLGTSSFALDLLREACMVEALDHPGIPRVYECGMLPDRRPWIATELVDGTSLASLRDRAVLTVRQLAALVRDVADILDHAHARGLVHRNVTPEAVVVPRQHRRFPVYLVDWSGARTRDSRTPLPMASPTRYAAPERARGITDERADIYALGVIAREALRTIETDCRPPILTALAKTMAADDPAQRPAARHVRAHLDWLVDALDRAPDPAVPVPVREERTELLSRAIAARES